MDLINDIEIKELLDGQLLGALEEWGEDSDQLPLSLRRAGNEAWVSCE